MNGNLTIRMAAITDAGAIAALLVQLGYPCTAEQAARRITLVNADTEQAIFVAVQASNKTEICVGFAAVASLYSFHLGAKLCRLSSLVVDQETRSMGIGKQLLERAESWARTNHCHCIELASNMKRSDAHRFYQRENYQGSALRFVKHLEN